VQILVTVAITQIEKLRIEVEKGFKCTMFELESVDPNVSIRTWTFCPIRCGRSEFKREKIWGGFYHQPLFFFFQTGFLIPMWSRSRLGRMYHRKGRSFNDTPHVEYYEEGQPKIANATYKNVVRQSKSCPFLSIRSCFVLSFTAWHTHSRDHVITLYGNVDPPPWI